MTKNLDVYQIVTDRIIAEMENGVIPWQMPWIQVNAGAVKHRSGEAYSLLNQILLGKPGEYLSFNECKAAGGRIKKGAKAKIVVFWKILGYQATDADGNAMFTDEGEAVTKQVPFLKYSNVFHIDDCEGIEPKWAQEPELYDTPADERAEGIITDYLKREGIGFENRKQNRAFYSAESDSITMPLREQFAQAAEYYSAAFHEITHSTGHPNRLNRFGATLKNAERASEELVAEIGSAILMNQIGAETTSSFQNSTAYIQSWLKALKNDSHLLINAACKADKAVRLILNQPA